ncbi:MAG: hypothetical protein ACM3JL_00480 [Nitrososphaerota archaeon]
MSKKLIAACMALAAFAAFAVAPSIAAAENSPEVTHPTGTTLATGTKITATNVGETKFTSTLPPILCNSAYMTGELTENTGSSVKADITAAGFTGTGTGGDCTGGELLVHPTPETGTNGLPWCLTSNSEMVTDEFKVRGGSCTEEPRPIEFALDITGVATCTYQRTTPISGTFTTHPEDAILTITGVAFTKTTGQSFFCPTTGELEMSFTLETDTETAEPIYIS